MRMKLRNCSWPHPHLHLIFPIFCVVSARPAMDLESLRNRPNGPRLVIEGNERLGKHCSAAATSHSPIENFVCRIHSGRNFHFPLFINRLRIVITEASPAIS
jgi:hypothetical protein